MTSVSLSLASVKSISQVLCGISGSSIIAAAGSSAASVPAGFSIAAA